jgi:hypothetical protein
VLGGDGMRPAAAAYRSLAQQWEAFAEAALPNEAAEFAETKRLLRRRHAAILQGGEAWREGQAETEALAGIYARIKAEFPLDEAGVRRLFESMQEHLMGLYAGEREVLEILKGVVKSINNEV